MKFCSLLSSTDSKSILYQENKEAWIVDKPFSWEEDTRNITINSSISPVIQVSLHHIVNSYTKKEHEDHSTS